MITYEPFFETLKRKGITTYKLINEYNFSKGTLDSLKQNKNITMETLNYICNLLECEVDDVIKYTSDWNITVSCADWQDTVYIFSYCINFLQS